MALLQNLADELLSEIFSYLIDDKLLLCFIASQSKRLSELIRPLLARHVRFITRPPSKSYQLFVRSVTESSLFASMVQDVILTWSEQRAPRTIAAVEIIKNRSVLGWLMLEARVFEENPYGVSHESKSQDPISQHGRCGEIRLSPTPEMLVDFIHI
jgi:hypothetical protein